MKAHYLTPIHDPNEIPKESIIIDLPLEDREKCWEDNCLRMQKAMEELYKENSSDAIIMV